MVRVRVSVVAHVLGRDSPKTAHKRLWCSTVALRSSKPQVRVRISFAAQNNIGEVERYRRKCIRLPAECSTGVMVNATVLYTAESWFESRVEYKLRDLGSKVEQTVEARRVWVQFPGVTHAI